MPAPIVIVHDDIDILHALADALAHHGVAKFDEAGEAWPGTPSARRKPLKF